MFEKIIKSLIYGLTAILLAVFFHYLGWLRPLENLTVGLLGPVQHVFYGVSQRGNNFYSAWIQKRDLLQENEQIKAELVRMTVDASKLKSLEEENVLLKKELNFVEQNKFKFVAARIISGVADPLSQSVIINRGRRDGIEKNLAVISNEGVMVGKTIDVYDDFSKVLLLSDNKSKVAATVQNLDHTVGLVEGQYGLSFAMTNIPQNQGIKEGDLVVTSGLEGKIPKDLLIAKVDRVKSVDSEIFKTAILTPIISLSSLSNVIVIIP